MFWLTLLAAALGAVLKIVLERWLENRDQTPVANLREKFMEEVRLSNNPLIRLSNRSEWVAGKMFDKVEQMEVQQRFVKTKKGVEDLVEEVKVAVKNELRRL